MKLTEEEKQKLRTMTELELQATKVPWFDTFNDLREYISILRDRKHDYGTCVYAASMSALATMQYISSTLGMTGFQASCADLDIIRRNRNLKHGFRIIDYQNLLYPQYENHEMYNMSFWGLIFDNIKTLKEAAKKLLDEDNQYPEEARANIYVREHWQRILDIKEIEESA